MKYACPAAAVAVVLLVGCAPALQRQMDFEKGFVTSATTASGARLPVAQAKGSAADAEHRARLQASPPVARHATKPWFGSRMVAMQSDEQLPPVFYERFTFNFNDASSRVALPVVAERVYQLTNVPVRISADVYATPNGQHPEPTPPRAAMAMPTPGSSSNRPGQPPGPVPSGPLPPLPQGGPQIHAELTAKQSSAAAVTEQPVINLEAIDMVWKDRPMIDFLTTVTDRLGLSWSYRDGVVTIHRYVTETFEVAAFASAQDYSMSLSGASQGRAGASGGAGGSSASSLQVNETGKNNPLQSLVQAVTKMLAGVPGSSVTLSEGTSRLTVTTTKEALREVRTLVRGEQAALTRQVLIQIDIYSMSDDRSQETGWNLDVLFQSLTNTLGARLVSPASTVSTEAGGLAMNILSLAGGGDPSSDKVRRWGDSKTIISALNQKGVSVQHQPLTMIAMNRQWARKTNLRQTGYLAETVPSTVAGAGSGAPGLKTSDIITGDRFLVQPAVLDNGAVLLKFGVSLTNLIGLFDVSAGSGATFQRVQTPEVSGTDDQSTVMLRAGEVMVLTGLTRYKSDTSRRTLGEGVSAVLGGSKKIERSREDFIIFVRPVIL